MSRRNKNRPAGGTEKPMTATLDAFSNPLFSLGYGSQSPLEATEYPLTRMTDNYALLNSLYRSNWVVQNVVGLLVDDMLTHWCFRQLEYLQVIFFLDFHCQNHVPHEMNKPCGNLAFYPARQEFLIVEHFRFLLFDKK